MLRVPTLERLDVHALRAVVTTFRDTVAAHSGGLNRLNVYPVPDGDTGTNMARTLDAVVTEMESAPETLDATCDAISHGSLMGARGNSGVILSQILRGLATTIKSQAETTGARFADALGAAATGAYQAVLRPIEGTILTVVRESAEAAREAADRDAGLVEVIRVAREAGRASLARTPELLPVLADAGVVDAGGAGYLLLLDSALHVVDGEPLPEPDETEGPSAEALAAVAHRDSADGLDVSEQRYEVMYLLDLVDENIDAFKQAWGAIGDSIVVVGGDGLWNCHVHTNEIGAAIEAALSLDGRPREIRVTDLFSEVAEEHEKREAEMTGERHTRTRAGGGLPRVTTAIVAVCSGDGLAELFSNLRVQGIVTGGQTLNPSTAELLETVDRVNADQVIILPNNKNIIPVAEQVDALTSRTVIVVPTVSMPEALAALIVYDPESDADENAAEMVDAIASVTTGEVTRAVRASRSDAGDIAEGDWIGITRGEGIASVAPDVVGAALTLVDGLLADGAELLTVITGADATPAVTAEIEGHVAAVHPEVQIEVHRGGQPLYPYLFGAE
ncbi:MAG: DAK2 domain-containing protein [Actinobacteria bacterium]|nr:DAK2 domain-containing protein [Actinomycetota bacterium]